MARTLSFLSSCLFGMGLCAFVACGPHINGEAVYGLGGHIRGAVSGGVTVVLDSARITTTDREGAYFFSGLYYESYSITPSLSGFAFSPGTKTMSPGDTNPNAGDFTSALGNPDACPSGYEGLLNGPYVFLLRGVDSAGGIARAGTFVADGVGGISSGREDRISLGSGAVSVSLAPSGSFYSLGADQRGCLTLEDSAGMKSVFRFSVGGVAPSVSGMPSASAAFTGRLIEFDAPTSGRRGEGILRRQDEAALSTSTLEGAYVVALSGVDVGGGRYVTAGVVTAAGGNFSQGVFDANASGTLAPTATGVGGTYSVASNGRGVASLGGRNYVLYAVSSSEFIALSSSAPSAVAPLLGGELFRQGPATFDNASLNATVIVSQSGSARGSSGSKVSIGALSSDGGGNLALVLDENDSGSFVPLAVSSGTYAVALNGRATAVLGNRTALLYFFDVNRAVVLGEDAEASFGVLEPQQLSPYADESLGFLGRFMAGTEGAALESRPIQCGALWFDGKSNYTGSIDQSTSSAQTPNLLSNPGVTFSFSPGSVVGRGTLDSNTPPSTIAYLVQSGRMVYLQTQVAWPVLTFIEE